MKCGDFNNRHSDFYLAPVTSCFKTKGKREIEKIEITNMTELQIKKTKMNIMKTMTKSILLILLCVTVSSYGQKNLKQEKITSQELIAWQTVDKGKSTIQGDEFIIEEIEGSDGYFLINPKLYPKDFTLNYKVKVAHTFE